MYFFGKHIIMWLPQYPYRAEYGSQTKCLVYVITVKSKYPLR